MTYIFTGENTPFFQQTNASGSAIKAAYSPTLNLLVVAGNGGFSAYNLITTTKNGPWLGYSLTKPDTFPISNVSDVSWSPVLNKFVVVGSKAIAASSDGVTWSSVATTFGASDFYNDVMWSSTLNKFIASGGIGGGSGRALLATSTNGTTWVEVSTPWNVSQGVINDICYSPELGLWVAVGQKNNTTGTDNILTSTDFVNWTSRVCALNANASGIIWSSSQQKFYVSGINSPLTKQLCSSPNGISWTNIPTLFGSNPAGDSGYCSGIFSAEESLFLCGTNFGFGTGAGRWKFMIQSDDWGSTWTLTNTSHDFEALNGVYISEWRRIYALGRGTLNPSTGTPKPTYAVWRAPIPAILSFFFDKKFALTS